MATYTLISSNVLASSAASVTFSAIPATYTDLVVKISGRYDSANVDTYFNISFNAGTASDVSTTRLSGNGSAASSGRTTAVPYATIFSVNGDSSTANTFASIEYYIPNYASSIAKPISAVAMPESNLTSPVTMNADAILFNSTSAITSLTFSRFGDNLMAKSSFYLYGISNA